jgi:hypothetical protein
MAKYRITDNQSGKTLVISGENPPTEQEAEELFNQSGIRNVPKMTREQALSKQVPVSGSAEYKPNPVLEGAGKLQEFLGNSPLLPILAGAGARAAVSVPVISSAIGSMAGERVKQSLAEGGPMAALKMIIPSLEQNEETKQNILKTGAIAGATDVGASIGGKALKEGTNIIKGGIESKNVNPVNILRYLRNQAADKAGNVDTQGLIKAANQFVKDNPLAKETWDLFQPTIKKNMPAKDLLRKMVDVFGNAYTKGGTPRPTDQAQLFDILYKSGKNIMKEQAPDVAKYTSGMRQLLTAPNTIQKAAWLLAKLGIAAHGF